MSSTDSFGFLHEQQKREINETYQAYIKRLNTDIIRPYDPSLESWAKQEKEIIKKEILPVIELSLGQLLNNQNPKNSGLPTKDRRHYLLLLKEQSDNITDFLNAFLMGESVDQNDFEAIQYSFQNYLNLLKINAKSALERKHIQDIENQSHAIIKRMHEILKKHTPEQKLKTITLLNQINLEEFNDLAFALNEFSRNSSFQAANSLNELNKVVHGNKISFLAFFAAMIALTIFITIYLYKRITQPISDVANLMVSLLDGNTQIRIPYKNRKDEIGQISLAVAGFRDHIIARNQVKEQLLYQKELAESASLAKAQFLAAMSHEIRTPMNGVVGMIDLLERSPLNVSQKNIVGTVKQSAITLMEIVDDILDFSRIEAGKLHIANSSFELRNLVEQVMDSLSSTAENKNVTLSLYIPPSTPRSFCSDQTRIRQVLYNLIGNGIKFSGEKATGGYVSVNVHVEAKEEQYLLLISIEDNGVGIAQDQIHSIFKPFTQAQMTQTNTFGGSGLGLAICKNVLNLMQGDIQVRSQKDAGTRFDVTLPLESNLTSDENLDTAMSTWESSRQINQSLKCYINLPPSPMKTALKSYLNDLDVPFDVVNFNTLETINFLAENQQGVIICSDFAEVKNHLLMNESATHLRYLLLNPSFMPPTHLPKSCLSIHASPLKLSQFIEGLLTCAALDENQTETKQPTQTIEKINLGRILVAEDNSTNQDVIQKQLEFLGFEVVMTNNGAEALKAYQTQDFVMVLTDCQMPVMDGYELTKNIRDIQAQKQSYTPILAISANALIGEAERCKSLGMDDFITKPVEISTMEPILKHWLNQKESTSKTVKNLIQESAIVIENNQIEINPDYMDLSVITRLFLDDKKLYLNSLKEFNKTCLPELIELSRTSHETTNLPKIKMITHKYKTSSRSVGAIKISDRCRSIETAIIHGITDLREDLSALNNEVNHSSPIILSVIEQLERELLE